MPEDRTGKAAAGDDVAVRIRGVTKHFGSGDQRVQALGGVDWDVYKGQMTLIVPSEARETASVWRWIERHVSGNGPIRRVEVVDVRQSMANGGGPACLRLRVVADPTTVDPRFIVDEAKLDAIADVVRRHWPEQIHHDDLQNATLIASIERARGALLDALGLTEL